MISFKFFKIPIYDRKEPSQMGIETPSFFRLFFNMFSSCCCSVAFSLKAINHLIHSLSFKFPASCQGVRKPCFTYQCKLGAQTMKYFSVYNSINVEKFMGNHPASSCRFLLLLPSLPENASIFEYKLKLL